MFFYTYWLFLVLNLQNARINGSPDIYPTRKRLMKLRNVTPNYPSLRARPTSILYPTTVKHQKFQMRFPVKASAYNNAPRIVGGKPASLGDFPFQVAVQCGPYKFCGGVLYTSKTVITAGHCCEGFQTNVACDGKITLRVGTINLSTSDGQTMKLDNYLLHPSFDGNKFHNDICLLFVKEPFLIDNKTVGTLPLADGSFCKVGDTCVVSGFGGIKAMSPTEWFPFGSDALMFVDVPILKDEECKIRYKNYDEQQMICAGYIEGGKDSCKGDSGGPMSRDGKLCGIVSFGTGCAWPNITAAYTKVSQYAQWINENTKF